MLDKYLDRLVAEIRENPSIKRFMISAIKWMPFMIPWVIKLILIGAYVALGELFTKIKETLYEEITDSERERLLLWIGAAVIVGYIAWIGVSR